MCALLLSGVLGCRGEDISFDCEHQMEAFVATAEREVMPLVPIPAPPPYAAVIRLSEESLNRILVHALAQNVPFSGEVPFGILPQGPGTAAFEPESAPKVALRPVAGCPECVVFQLDFRVGLSASGTPLSTGVGWVDLAIPLYLQEDPAGAVHVVADYGRADIDDWYLSVFGFDSEQHDSLSGATQLFLEKQLRESFGPTILLTLPPWVIETEAVLVTRDLLVDTTRKHLVLGLATNLPFYGSGRDLREIAPDPTAALFVAMDTEIFGALAHRLLGQGTLPRRYREDGQPDEGGTYGVTLHELAPASANTFRTELRLWRIAEGYCGRAAIEMPLELQLEAGRLALAPGPADLVVGHPDNQGAGVAAEEDESLVEEHRSLVSTFANRLTDLLTRGLQFPSLEVPRTTLRFEPRSAALVETSLEMAIDMQVFLAE